MRAQNVSEDAGPLSLLNRTILALTPGLVIASMLIFVTVAFTVVRFDSWKMSAHSQIIYVSEATSDPASHFVIPNDALFTFDSSKLSDGSHKTLLPLISKLKKAEENSSVLILGHSDNIARSAQYNAQLSQQRAEAVRRYFLEAGVSAEKMEAVGLGTRAARIPKGHCAGLPLDQRIACESPNRRVEIWIKDDSSSK